MKRNKGRLWSEPFGAGYNAWGGGGCEAVFLVSGKNSVKGLVTSIGAYWYI